LATIESSSIPVRVDSTQSLPAEGLKTTRREGRKIEKGPGKEARGTAIPSIEATTNKAEKDTDEHADRFATGTHSPIIEAPVYRMKDGFLRATITRSAFLKSAGREFEVGKEYEIRGRAEGIGSFETSHVEREESKSRERISLAVGRDDGHLPSGRRCKITIESVTEREHFRVSSGERRLVEMWQPAMISVGLLIVGMLSKEHIAEFRAKNTSESGEASKRCFVTVRPEQKSIGMRVGKLGFKPGDIITITDCRPYGIEDFVKDFNTHRRIGLENTFLESRQGALVMRVDNRRIELRNSRLGTAALQATLSAEIGDSKRPIRFRFDGQRINPRLDLFRIRNARASETGLTISYMKDRSHRRSFHYSFDEFGAKHLQGLRLISAPETKNDSFHYRVSHKLQENIRLRLTEKSDGLALVKGTISEKIQRYILSNMPDRIEVEAHPFDKVRRADDSRKNGPDGLWRSRSTGELYFLEFKWRQGSKDSYYEGCKEVRRYLAKYPTYKEERISGGYVGLIEWNTKSRDLFFYLRKVDPARDSRDT